MPVDEDNKSIQTCFQVKLVARRAFWNQLNDLITYYNTICFTQFFSSWRHRTQQRMTLTRINGLKSDQSVRTSHCFAGVTGCEGVTRSI